MLYSYISYLYGYYNKIKLSNFSKDIINYACEYVLDFISIIKTKNKENYLFNKINSFEYLDKKGDIFKLGNKILLVKDKKEYILNLVNKNKVDIDNNKSDCIIIEYDVNDEANIKYIELLSKDFKSIDKRTYVYFIGINFISEEKVNIPQHKEISDLNNIKHFSITSKDDQSIIRIFENLLSNLQNEEIPNNIDCNKSYSYKIILLGGICSGKTCLFKRIKYYPFDNYSREALGLHNCTEYIQLKTGKKYV